jgi:hypothetical protein
MTDLMSLIGPSGKSALSTALMQDPEFYSHCEKNLVDSLRVDRRGALSQSACYADGSVPASADGPALAQHVRNNGPGSPFAVPAGQSAPNMTALVRSALRLDDLSPVFRAHMFPHVNRPITGADISEQNRRDDLAVRFMGRYLERDLGCLGCHNSGWSISGEGSGWDRTWPIPGNFEKALFGNNAGRSLTDVAAIFRSPGGGAGSIGGSVKPWGLEGCGSFVAASSVAGDSYNPFPSGPAPRPYFASVVETSATAASRKTVWDLEASLRVGIQGLASNGLDRSQGACTTCNGCSGASTTPGAGYAAKREAARAALQTRCGSCHHAWNELIGDSAQWDSLVVRVSAQSQDRPLVMPNDLSASWLYQRVANNEMPPSPLSASAKADLLTKLQEWIAAMPASTGCSDCAAEVCDGFPRELDPNEAFAHMVAENAVNNAYEEIFGERLTIANHFPRNSSQMNLLWNLTNRFLKPGGGGQWSLKEVLRKLVTSKLFNRMSPANGDGSEPYELPLIFDPWPATPAPATPAEGHNSMTEAVHRYSPQALLGSLSRALDWPQPRRFQGGGYPDDALKEAMGQYLDQATPGFDSVGFQSLLHWENVHGACAKPPGPGGTPYDDWIDRLMNRVAVHPLSHSGTLPTYRDVVAALKDRLLGDGSISTTAPDPSGPGGAAAPSEEDLLEQHFGVTSLDNGAAATATLATQVRGLCGVLAESPQFMLAGVVPSGGLGSRPVLAEPIYRQRCQALVSALRPQGYNFWCFGNTVIHAPVIDDNIFVHQALGRLCPKGICGPLPWPADRQCLRDPRKCIPRPPLCDPRCTDMHCCGEFMEGTPSAFEGALYGWLEGAEVKLAKGVSIQSESGGFSPLKPGTVLSAGDWLLLPPGSELALVGADKEELRTPPGGVKPKGTTGKELQGQGDGAWAYLVAGVPKDLPKGEPLAEAKVSKEALLRVQRLPWRRWGAAGVRLPSDTPVFTTPEAAKERGTPGELPLVRAMSGTAAKVKLPELEPPPAVLDPRLDPLPPVLPRPPLVPQPLPTPLLPRPQPTPLLR